jgi:hypothetical protein
MKRSKKILNIMIMFVLSLYSVNPIFASDAYEVEENDDITKYTYYNSYVSNMYGKIDHSGDVDFYGITIPHSGVTNFWIDVPDDKDIII